MPGCDNAISMEAAGKLGSETSISTRMRVNTRTAKVLRWFDAADLEYISSIPRIDGGPLNDNGELFVARSRGSPLDRG